LSDDRRSKRAKNEDHTSGLLFWGPRSHQAEPQATQKSELVPGLSKLPDC
jgi:hypothetical protein